MSIFISPVKQVCCRSLRMGLACIPFVACHSWKKELYIIRLSHKKNAIFLLC